MSGNDLSAKERMAIDRAAMPQQDPQRRARNFAFYKGTQPHLTWKPNSMPPSVFAKEPSAFWAKTTNLTHVMCRY